MKPPLFRTAAAFLDGTMVIENLLANIDTILGRLTESDLRRYAWLQKELLFRDVSADREYQRTFNGYYKMQRRKETWYRQYFGLLENMKDKQSVSFDFVLKDLYKRTERIEASFSSKFVASIQPEMPVYDKYVRQNLGLQAPGQWLPAGDRLSRFMVLYDVLVKKCSELIDSPTFSDLRSCFDKQWGKYASFTDAKKLDLLLWQHRR